MSEPRQRNQTLVVLSLALLLRLLVLYTALTRYPAGWFFTRGQEMGLLAKSLVEGHGLSSPFGRPTGPTAFIAPGYPILVAAFFRLFGTYSVTAAVALMLFQIALNLLTIWLILLITRKLFGHGAAWLSGLIWACGIPIIWIPTIFWDTSLAICLFMGLFALILRFRDHVSTLQWLFLGAYTALTALINPAMLPAMAVLLAWLAFQQRPFPIAGPLLAALAFSIVFSPWPIRNARVFHSFIPTRTTVGFELWMGNRANADGFLDESLFPSFNSQELQAYKTMGELAYTANKSTLAKQFIEAHPATFLRLTLARITRYWIGTGSRGGSPLFAAHAIFTSFLGLAGTFLLFRRHKYALASLFAIPVLIFPLPYYITHAEFRYRLALDPPLTILTSYTLVTLFTSKPIPPADHA